MQLDIPCKINFGLHILNRRPDGYHNIESVFYPVPLFDHLIVEHSQRFSFTMSGIDPGGVITDNLCVKAFEMMQQEYGIGAVAIHLHKNIPVGAGLGGGSADGAYVIKALNTLFGLNLDGPTCRRLAGRLGSDCPFFIDAVPALAEGRGEVLTPVDLDLSGYWLVLAKPAVGVSTREAFARVHPCTGRVSPATTIQQPVDRWHAGLTNDFEDSVVERLPVVNRIKSSLLQQGALYAQMSGSGSALFGLFGVEPAVIIPEAGFLTTIHL